jgi:hypothetical protein
LHGTICRLLRRPGRHSDCLMSPARSVADYQRGPLNPVVRRRPAWFRPPSRQQHRLNPPKTSASTPRLSRRIGRLGPAVELPDATAEPLRVPVLVARSPAAVQRGTASLAKPALKASSVQWGRLVMQVRPDRSAEARLPT